MSTSTTQGGVTGNLLASDTGGAETTVTAPFVVLTVAGTRTVNVLVVNTFPLPLT